MTKVLVVDNNEIDVELFKLMLRDFGCHISVAMNNLEAREKIEKEDFDVFLVDLQISFANPFQLIEEVRSEKEKNVIIYVLGPKIKGDTLVKALKLGVDGYFTKPINDADLKDAFLKLKEE